jgi:uncharacterized protein DUF4019
MNVRFWQVESKFVSPLVLLIFLLVICAAAHAQQKPEQLAQQASDPWLALVDSGKYAESWQEASQFFKAAVTREQWQSMLRASRDPLGKMLSRKVKTATYTKTLPGAPDGEYVVIQYESSFEHKQSAVETVTPMLDKDGKWRVSGYFIK